MIEGPRIEVADVEAKVDVEEKVEDERRIHDKEKKGKREVNLRECAPAQRWTCYKKYNTIFDMHLVGS